MSEFAIVDLGSKFIKYALKKANQELQCFELNLVDLLDDLKVLKELFQAEGINRVLFFLPDDYYKIKILDLSSKQLSKGLILEVEQQFQQLQGKFFYANLPYNNAQLSLYETNAKESEMESIKGVFQGLQVEFYPAEIAYSCLNAKKVSLLDVGHYQTYLLQIVNHNIETRLKAEVGFALFVEMIQEYAKISSEPAFELALDYLKHPATLNSKQLEICQQAARKFARALFEKLNLENVQILYLTGGGSFVPELIQKLYEADPDLKILHLSDELGSSLSIYNNLYCFERFYLNKRSNKGYNVNEQINRLLKVYNLNF